MKALEIEHLTKFYGETRGIENLNLTVDQGAFFGFIGPNGAGKSTTIRALLGLIHANSGAAQILGLDFKKDREEILKHVGYLPSEVSLYEGLTGRELLKYACGFYNKWDEARMKHLADRFEYDVDKKIEALSLGNKKKLGIMQVLIHRPKLLIMDEPTGGLDPLMQARFFELIHEERSEGTTVFFSSHTLSEVQKHCEEVAVIREGRILETTSVLALRKKQLKHIRLVLKTAQQDIVQLTNMQGVFNLSSPRSSEYLFDFDGDFQVLLSLLANWQVDDILVEEPALEDIFMHYYSKQTQPGGVL